MLMRCLLGLPSFLSLSLSFLLSGNAQAAEYLQQQESTNFAAYMHGLCIELGSKDRDLVVRRLAGLNIKNAVDKRSEEAQQLLHNRWKALPDVARAQIKGMMLQILHDEQKEVRRVAALVRSTRHCVPFAAAPLLL